MDPQTPSSQNLDTTNQFLQNGSYYSLTNTTMMTDNDLVLNESHLNEQLLTEQLEKIKLEGHSLKELPEEKKMNNVNIQDSGGSDQKESAPFIKTVMTDRPMIESEKFNMKGWAEFQEILKSNYLVVKTEFEAKLKIMEEINQLVKEHTSYNLSIRENNEKIRKILAKEDIDDEEMIKVILDDKDNRLGDASHFVKKLLHYLYDRPKILAIIVKNHPNSSSLKMLQETLCNTFYEDIIADEVYDDDLLRLLAELLEVEFDKAKKNSDLFQTENFTNKILSSYLKRTECKRYIKGLIKDPLLISIRETTKIRLNPEEVQRQLERRLKLQKSMASSEIIPKEQNKLKDSERRSSTRKTSESDEVDKIYNPKFKSRRQKQEDITSEPKPQEEAKKNDKKIISFLDPDEIDNYIESSSPTHKGVPIKDVARILERNFSVLKKHLSVLIQSIFDHLYSMPIGLRILCKMIYLLAQKKFPLAGIREYYEILYAYLFRKWIIPGYIFPLTNGILDDFHLNEDISNNLMEITKVLQVIFSLSIYPAEDVKSFLNDYIKEIQPSVVEYYRELIGVNEDLISQILNRNRFPPNRITLRTICISVHEVQIICEAIEKQRELILPISSEVINLVEKLDYYNREYHIFSEKTHSATSRKLKTNQSYLLFNDWDFPVQFIKNYPEEFGKMGGFSKSLPEDQKVFSVIHSLNIISKLLCRAKHLLRQFMVSIEDIKNLMRLSTHEKVSLDDILEKYQDKLYSHESKHSSNEKTPMNITAMFLASTLNHIENSYRENNYYKLYKEMFHEFKQMAEQLDFSISNTKIQLLKALDNLRRNCKNLKEANEKKVAAIEKTSIRELIKTITIPLCITSPSTMKHLDNDAKKSKKKLLSSTDPEKIVMIMRDETGCIHERFAIIKELAPNNGPIGSQPQKRSTASFGKTLGPDDLFNENNHHCNTIDQFAQVFGSLAEVKEAILKGKDRYGVNQAIMFFYNKISTRVRITFKNLTEEKFSIIMDEIENYICKRLYNKYKVFPQSETEDDKRFWKRCKLLEWTNFDHLEVIPRNRCVEMWEYAAKVLNQIDNRLTPLDKLYCIVECFRSITQVLELASAKEGGGGADETLPIMLYVLLRACPKRIHSNMNFITMLRDHEKMQAREGYCFTQVQSAVLTIESLDHRFYKMSEEEFLQLMLEKEILYGFHRK